MPGVLAMFELNQSPHYRSFCRWEQEYRMRELRRLLRRGVEQADRSSKAEIDASASSATDQPPLPRPRELLLLPHKAR
jgi:hypothetical protein